ncbi:MAG: hypothetical protein ACRDSE_07685 [Pseudonocardiaceae bacterium]
MAPIEQGVAAFDQVVAVGPARLWSQRCSWDELAVLCDELAEVRGELDLAADWPRRWTAAWRFAGGEVACASRDLGCLPVAGCEPVRRFSWRRTQRHRAGLQFLVSTGRHHGFESLEEARLLLALDFAGDLVDVLGQPMRLRYLTREGRREHVPDFLAFSRTGRWLVAYEGATWMRLDLLSLSEAREVVFAPGAFKIREPEPMSDDNPRIARTRRRHRAESETRTRGGAGNPVRLNGATLASLPAG